MDEALAERAAAWEYRDPRDQTPTSSSVMNGPARDESCAAARRDATSRWSRRSPLRAPAVVMCGGADLPSLRHQTRHRPALRRLRVRVRLALRRMGSGPERPVLAQGATGRQARRADARTAVDRLHRTAGGQPRTRYRSARTCLRDSGTRSLMKLRMTAWDSGLFTAQPIGGKFRLGNQHSAWFHRGVRSDHAHDRSRPGGYWSGRRDLAHR